MENDKKYYQTFSQEERAHYLREMLNIPQVQGQYTPLIQNYQYESDFEYNFQSSPGKKYKMHYYHTRRNVQPRAVLFFIHGFNSYGGNSGFLANNIVKQQQNIDFYSLDFINFGKSQGDSRGYIHSFQEIVRQAKTFINYIMQKYQNSPKIYLVGQSFGGAISFKLSLLDKDRYSGIIFLNPALRQIKQSKYYLKKIGKVIGYFFPKLKLTPQCHRSSTKYNLQDYILNNKNLYNDRNIPGSVRVVLNAIQQIQNSYIQLAVPYILFQGGVDKSVDLFAPLDLQKACKSKDKTTIYFKSMWHSMFYEQQIVQVTQRVKQWLSKRI